MALTELQLPTKTNFYGKIRAAATQMDRHMGTWKDLADFIGTVEVSDLDAMEVAAGQVRTDLANFRTVLNEIVSFYAGDSVTPLNTPSDVMDKLREM